MTYTVGNLAITGGKFIGSLGTESFDGLNNAFISYSALAFSSPYATGVKAEYTTNAFMAGVSVRDSQFGPDQGVKTGNFFEGDGSFKNDLGYEGYFIYSGIDKFKLGAGFGYQKVNDFAPGEDRTFTTYDVWASYALTEKLTLLAECAAWRESVDYSWNMQASYAFTADWSGAVRVTGSEGYQAANDVFGYGVASTYNICKNFALKAEVTKTENNAVDTSDVFSYALQAVLKF